MTDEQIVKALPTVAYGGHSCNKCKYKYEKGECRCGLKGCRITRNALDLINRQQAEIERLHKLQKPTEASGFKIEDGKVVFYTNMLNGYRHELKDLDEVVEELNLMLQEAYKTDEIAGGKRR